jgi:D-arabinose 1-dehydrogenase-like Zn-dependent alcohol dehydrogenase
MKKTYRAMQATRPGLLELVERETTQPAAGEVLIAVEACGVCGADAGTVEGLDASVTFPRVPGHEVVGRIVAVGTGTSAPWAPGQRVGVGRLGGHCNACEPCRRGSRTLTVAPGLLVGGERIVRGAITGSPFESEKTLAFSVLADVRAMIETLPLQRAQEAYQRMRSGQARFRMVLTTGRSP